MMKVQLAVGAAVALLAFAAVPQAHADVYDYGYGPVYGGYSVSNGACPNGQCSGSYSPLYSATYPVYSAQSYSAQSYGPQTCPSGSCGTCPNGSCGMRGQCAGGQCSSGQCVGERMLPTGQCSTGQGRLVVAEMDVAERVRAATASVGIAAESAPTGSARRGIGERSIRRACLPHGTTIVPITGRARRLRIAPATRQSGPHIGTTGTNRFRVALGEAIRDR